MSVIGIALAACSSAAATSGSASPVADAVASFAGTGVDWDPRGNKSSDSTISDAAVRLWKSGMVGDKLQAGEKLLYAGDTDMAGSPDGECGVVAVAGRTTDNDILIGWFGSVGALTPTNLVYLGETKPSNSQSAEGIATGGVCPDTGAQTAIALAAPGFGIAPPTPMDLAPGESGPSSPLALWSYKVGTPADAVITKNGEMQSTFEIAPQPRA